MVRPELLWQEATHWLYNARVLGEEKSRILRLSDLAAILRDGILLCRLANTFSYGCIDQTHIFLQPQQSQKSRFSCSNNIRLFLDACRTTFHIPESELFEENDLYDLDDFERVLRLLSHLSHTDKAKKVLSNLRDEVEAVEEKESIYDAVYNYGKEESEKEMQIYDTIVVNSNARISSKDAWANFKPSSQREHCIKELLDTETNYVENALDMILAKFYDPLRFLLNPEDMEAIFINIYEIATFHRSFHLKLRRAVLFTLGFEQRHSTESETRIGDVFINSKKRFIIYARYCSLMNASRARIEEIERSDDKKKRKIAELTTDANRGQFKLQDLLSVPMQRILKYHLLLEQLIKSTTIDDSEYQNLIDARDAMSDVNHYINEVKRDHEAMEIIRSIERSIVDLSIPDNKRISDYGRLQIDGVVKLADHDEGIRPKPRYVFIFDKMLLICKALKNNQYEFKGAHGIRDWTISEVETDNSYKANMNTITRKFTASIFDNTNLFLTKKKQNNESSTPTGNSIQIVLKSVAQRDQWKAAIKTAINNNEPADGVAKGHRLSYESFSQVMTCGICNKFLAGKFFQGYRCLRCKMDMHRECVGIQYCGGGRPSSSFSDRHSIEENGFTPFSRTEKVIAMQTVKSQDPTVLNFKVGDAIEVVEANDGNTFFGRLVEFPGKSGIVKCDCVKSMGITINRRHSSNSIVNSPNTPVADMSPMERPRSLVSREVLKINEGLSVECQPWFFGEIEREKANELLEGTADGTFIVRVSPNQRQFVVSVSYAGRQKHMKIEIKPETGEFYLHDGRMLPSVVELINFYRVNNLSEGFTNLDTTLSSTLLQTKQFRAVHDFVGTDSAKYLEFKRGDIVTVIDTVGEEKGWWRGRVGERIGFFPMTYVEKLSSSSSDETLNDSTI